MPEVPDLDIDTDGLFTEDEEESSYSIDFGTVENGIYSNKFAKLKFYTPSDDWRFLTKEEIYSHYDSLGSDVTFDDVSKETCYSTFTGNLYYDMFMYNTQTNQNIQVIIMECADNVEISLNDYFESVKDVMLSSYDNSTFESAGMVTLGDNIYSVQEANFTIDTLRNVTQYYAGTKIGNNLVIICITNNANSDESFIDIFESITE